MPLAPRRRHLDPWERVATIGEIKLKKESRSSLKLRYGRMPPRVDTMVEDQMTSEPVLTEPLTWREICARYPDEWVALVEIDLINENDLDFAPRASRVMARHAGSRSRRRSRCGRATRRSGTSSPDRSGCLSHHPSLHRGAYALRPGRRRADR